MQKRDFQLRMYPFRCHLSEKQNKKGFSSLRVPSMSREVNPMCSNSFLVHLPMHSFIQCMCTNHQMCGQYSAMGNIKVYQTGLMLIHELRLALAHQFVKAGTIQQDRSAQRVSSARNGHLQDPYPSISTRHLDQVIER